MVPKVYLYDGTMKAIIKEDMVGHSMMRTALLNHEIFLFSQTRLQHSW
ncbi:MAG: hypothetical protein V8R80_07080 [Eubacterium sp.]